MFFKIERRFAQNTKWIPLAREYRSLEEVRKALINEQTQFPMVKHRLLKVEIINED